MKVGLALPHYDFSYPDGRRADAAATVEWARRAEALGYDSVWVSDHFFLDLARYGGPAGRQSSIEPLTALAAVAAATSRVRFGTLVACEAFRPAAMLAHQAATLATLSGGRFLLGLGAGWYEDEFRAGGYEFAPPGERMTRLAATLATLRGSPSRPPLFVGSKGGPRSLRVVAETADGWNTVWRWTPEGYAARAEALDRACDKAGRDPATVFRSLGLYTLVSDDPPKTWATLGETALGSTLDLPTLEDFADGTLVGGAHACAERIAEFARLGVEELIVSPSPVPFAIPLADQVEAIAETLIPLVRDA